MTLDAIDRIVAYFARNTKSVYYLHAYFTSRVINATILGIIVVLVGVSLILMSFSSIYLDRALLHVLDTSNLGGFLVINVVETL